MNAPLAEQMAIAVLKGDLATARALADLLLHDWEGGAKEVSPTHVDGSPADAVPPRTVHPPANLYRISVPRERLRVVAYYPSTIDGQEVEVDEKQTARNIEAWLDGRHPLLLQGCERFDVYELPEWAVPKVENRVEENPTLPLYMTEEEWGDYLISLYPKE